MKKYYMSLDSLVTVDGVTKEERFKQAKQKFLEWLQSNEPIEITCVNEDDEDWFDD